MNYKLVSRIIQGISATTFLTVIGFQVYSGICPYPESCPHGDISTYRSLHSWMAPHVTVTLDDQLFAWTLGFLLYVPAGIAAVIIRNLPSNGLMALAGGFYIFVTTMTWRNRFTGQTVEGDLLLMSFYCLLGMVIMIVIGLYWFSNQPTKR